MTRSTRTALSAGILFGALALPATPAARADGPASRPSTQPWKFLGLADDQERKIEEENPQIDGRLRGITKVNRVEQVDYAEYLEARRKKQIDKEEPHGGFVYYSTTVGLCVDPAYVFVTKRYKARLPDEGR